MYFHREIKFEPYQEWRIQRRFSEENPKKGGSSIILVFAHYCFEQMLITMASLSTSLHPEINLLF